MFPLLVKQSVQHSDKVQQNSFQYNLKICFIVKHKHLALPTECNHITMEGHFSAIIQCRHAGYFCHRLRRYNTQQAHLIIRAFECVDSTKSERVSQNFTLCSIVQNWWRGVHMFCEHTASHSICGDVYMLATLYRTARVDQSILSGDRTYDWFIDWQQHPLDFGEPFHVYEDFPRKRYLSTFTEKGYIGS